VVGAAGRIEGRKELDPGPRRPAGPRLTGFEISSIRTCAIGPPSSSPLILQAAERDYILKKLDEAKGNVTRAADMLGLERSHLCRKMKALGIAAKE
jgi:transcriptional regulator of acetoin/glycerol metabolism